MSIGDQARAKKDPRPAHRGTRARTLAGRIGENSVAIDAILHTH
jgi:hypothetical protein